MAASSEARSVAGAAPHSKDGVEGASVTDLLVEALAAHRLGRLDAAGALYAKVLEVAPENPEALHLLGVLQHQAGNSDAAIALIDRAIAADGARAIYHANRATALQKLGRIDEAAAGYRRALDLDPINAEANANFGHLLKDLGETAEAMRRYRTALMYQPRVRSVHKHLATLCVEESDFEEAVELFRLYLAEKPDDAEANSNCGYALDRLDRPEEAEPYCRKAHEMAPDSAEICSNLGNVLKRQDKDEEAETYLAKAADLAPGNVEVQHNLALILAKREKYDEAIPLMRRLVEMYPDVAGFRQDLGACLGQVGRSSQALKEFLRADELEPNNVEHLTNIGNALTSLTRYPQAAKAYSAAIKARKEGGTAFLHAQLCMALQRSGKVDEANLHAHTAVQLPGWAPRMALAVNGPLRSSCDFDKIAELGDLVQICDEDVAPEFLIGAFLDLRPLTETLEADKALTKLHFKWGDAMLAQAEADPLPPLGTVKRLGKIRLGFLSSDLRSHVVAKFVKTLFDRYDRDRFEIYAYTTEELPGDPVQVELKRVVTALRITGQMNEREVAAAIRADEVDVLFELNGATGGGQLGALAWRPAPLQVSWLGYGGTSGLRTVDYALVDRFVKPTVPELWAEKFIEMEGAWVCFSGYPETPIPDELPLERNGVVTFGTMNSLYKITPNIVALWSRIMSAVEGSRMLLVRPEFTSVVARANLVKEFSKHGIAAERIFFIGNKNGQYTHLPHYNEMDIALDTYPAVGGTTSCDTMWMGVPVVGRYGPNMHQRLNHSLVNHCGLGDLSVETPDAYVDTAVALAQDIERLRALRHGLRDIVKRSPIYDADGFAQDFQDRVEELIARHGLR